MIPLREGETRFIRQIRGKTGIVYIPADVVKDSSFPFQPNDKVIVKIRGNGLIVKGKPRKRKEVGTGQNNRSHL